MKMKYVTASIIGVFFCCAQLQLASATESDDIKKLCMRNYDFAVCDQSQKPTQIINHIYKKHRCENSPTSDQCRGIPKFSYQYSREQITIVPPGTPEPTKKQLMERSRKPHWEASYHTTKDGRNGNVSELICTAIVPCPAAAD